MRLRPIALAIAACICLPLASQPRTRDFRVLCDTLSARMQRRTTVYNKLSVTKIGKSGNTLDLTFNSDLSYYPWHQDDVAWFRSQVEHEWGKIAGDYTLGRIITNRYELSELASPKLGNSGKPSNYSRKVDDPAQKTPRFIDRIGRKSFPNGLDDRYIALWQSHGRYYDESQGIWLWQRAQLFHTVEDMYTQSYVLPFLIPMLENSGAYVMTPRERDTNWREIITDNDPSFASPRVGTIRRCGEYSESGKWENAGEGFADTKPTYTFEDNPFKLGTARKAQCSGSTPSASIRWTPTIEQRGEYAVYISYKTLDNSTTAAHYSVHHLGGTTEFEVNQKRGGSTWIYLGTFEFDKGSEGYVALDNRGVKGLEVSADAVKIGGGMGKLERGGVTSGMPSSAEGAHYWMQWAGVDNSITRGWETDYTNDYASRGAWTVMMREQKDIPVDMALAFHTDAGVTPNDSTIGTLAIYTLRCDGEREFSDGRDRILSRLLCDFVQSQVVDDIRADFNPNWSRRGLWDKSYSECRTSGVPAMILELLSHQNFEDMKYGLDPKFRFTVCRAVYKGMLKTLSEYYGTPYVVQPLPVHAFSARLADGSVNLKWKETTDPKEPTANADSYIIYTRMDGGGFDDGQEVSGTSVTLPIERGHVYSYKVVACNSGGKSFPSEILTVGIPDMPEPRKVLIVNNFDRISAPSWIEHGTYAGFDTRADSGVPYLKEINYIGEVYEFDRNAEYIDNDYSGFGSTYDDHAGEIIAGNSFDYPYVHGKLLMELGYSVESSSREAWLEEASDAFALDLICGKQGTEEFPVLPERLRKAISAFAENGGNLFISGANIASDNGKDSGIKSFLETVLGCRLATASGSLTGKVSGMEFSNSFNPDIYSVERPDGLRPSGKKSSIWLRYPGSSFGVSVYFESGKYKSITMGVPLEVIRNEGDRMAVMKAAMEYFEGASRPSDL